ncbi:MAG: MBL fold metallo-hydrolase [Labilithrix sp.]|nr:MBL fold metallo-hydrolase [Labilithrix sp.]MCW5817442.1 MBL fold metallo-hydrolase [Labilithrix sp.]
MRVTFWGVRGSIPCPGRTHARYGGNTSCVELEIGSSSVVLDAGTGLRALGASLARRGVARIHLLLSHTHWDHTCGLPFFGPAYDPSSEITIVAGHASERAGGVCGILASQIAPPSFPVSLAQMPARLSFRDVPAGASFELEGGGRVRTARLVHPDGATGFRVEHAGASVAYVTDTEHEPGRLDPSVLTLIEGADLVIYDCTYTDEELASHRGWGHSTWEEGVRLCVAAGAKRLAIFHHDPDHDDAFMDRVAREAKRRWSGAFVAREGMTIALSPGRPRGAKR